MQHGEELRLALAAAAREVAGLQEQVTLAAAGLEGPQASALQAASRDAQRWREAAESRIAAAREVEEGLRREAAQLQQRAVANRTGTAQAMQQLLATFVASRRHSQQGPEEEGNGTVLEPRWPGMLAAMLPSSVAAVPAAGAAMPASQEQQQQRAAQPVPALAGLAAASQPPTQLHKPQPPQPLEQLAVQPQASAGPPRLPSRTASDILAAYRARQQRSMAGGSSAVAHATRSRSTSLSQEASEASTAGDGGGTAGGAGELPPCVGPAGQQGPTAEDTPMVSGPTAEDGAGIPEHPSVVYSDAFASDDSSRF